MSVVILVVREEHKRRAAEFCQRHRDFTTYEVMDDLATEFERVAREARTKALQDAAEFINAMLKDLGST